MATGVLLIASSALASAQQDVESLAGLLHDGDAADVLEGRVVEDDEKFQFKLLLYPSTRWACTRANWSSPSAMSGWRTRFGGDPAAAIASEEWRGRAEAALFRRLYR